MANHLAGQSSLYLRQHAEQPVDWHVFGPEAFAEAAARDVPVFLSVGYAACHWCQDISVPLDHRELCLPRPLSRGFSCV